MKKSSSSHTQALELVAHHRIHKLAFATASKKRTEQLYASQIYIRLVRAFLEQLNTRPSTPAHCVEIAENWDSFVSEVLFAPYREHCIRKHRSENSQASEVLHPKILSFPLAALRSCMALMRELDQNVYAALVAQRPGYVYSYVELRPLFFHEETETTRIYKETLTECFVNLLLETSEDEMFKQQGEFLRLVKTPFKHFDELGAFFELDEKGLAQTITLLCFADVVEAFQIQERQVEPFVTSQGELLPSGYDPSTFAVLWNKQANESSKRFFLELPAFLLKQVREEHAGLYLPLVRSFAKAVKNSKLESSVLEEGLILPLEFPTMEREKARFAEIKDLEQISSAGLSASEVHYAFELQQKEQDLTRDINRYKRLLAKKEREYSLHPLSKKNLDADVERIRNKLSKARRVLKRTKKLAGSAERNVLDKFDFTAQSTRRNADQDEGTRYALSLVDKKLPELWQSKVKQERKVLLRDPISAGYFRLSHHRSRRAKLVSRLIHTLDYESICREVPHAKEILDDIQIASALKKVDWDIARCNRYSRREVLRVAMSEAIFSQQNLTLSQLKSDFPEDPLFVNLIYQRRRLEQQLRFYVAAIKDCFTQLFAELKDASRDNPLTPLQQEQAVRTLFIAVWDWVSLQVVNPYAERLRGENDNENEVDKAKSYSFWLKRELSSLFEEHFPGLYSFLVLERPSVVYSAETIRDFVWQDSAARAHYVRILSSNLIKRLELVDEDEEKNVLESFLASLGSPFSLFLDEQENSLDTFTEDLFEFTDAQSEKIDSQTRRYLVYAWSERNETLWRGEGLQAGKLLTLILREIQKHKPALHTKLNSLVTADAAEKLKTIRDFRFTKLPEARGAERAEILQTIADLSSGIDELEFIHAHLEQTLREVDKRGVEEVYGRSA